MAISGIKISFLGQNMAKVFITRCCFT